MAFRPRRALAVFWKDFLDLRKNPALLAAMLALPVVMVVVPMGVVWTYVRDPNDPNLRVIALYYDPSLPLNAERGALPGRRRWPTGSGCSW